MARDKKNFNKTMRPITKAHNKGNRAIQNEIKAILGIGTIPATELKNAYINGGKAGLIERLKAWIETLERQEKANE